MILFYSDYCGHCRMLLETVKRHDTNSIVKLSCIENIKTQYGKVPAQITHVPALMILPQKKLLFGKEVFDYLLLPNQGKLMIQQPPTSDKKNIATNSNEVAEGPIAFSIGSGYSDSFSMIDSYKFDQQELLDDRVYNWTLLNDTEASSPSQPQPQPLPESDIIQEESTRKRKEIDLDAYKMERDLALKQIY